MLNYSGKLQEILKEYYGIEAPSLEFLREGGTHTYIVNGKSKYLLKVIGSSFSKTARQSIFMMRYLEESGFPVHAIILTKRSFFSILGCDQTFSTAGHDT